MVVVLELKAEPAVVALPCKSVFMPCRRRGQLAVAVPRFAPWSEDSTVVFVGAEEQQRKGTSTQMRADAGRAARAPDADARR
jgi:hypothetical protein